VSPWHDIPLYTEGGLINLITEIPKNTKAKMEIASKELTNPIAQDLKKGKLRDYHGPIYWNYGCFPQTWENPNEIHPVLKCFGDNDPLDVVEIGSSPLSIGSVTPVKPLGIFAMIDDGELDWKVIAINQKDPLFHKLNSVKDVEELLPGTISGIREWFRWYKTPDNKPLNKFGFNEECLSEEIAHQIIKETHESWKHLKAGKVDPKGLSLK
jgi:inorganic pyrophosphatase